MFAGRTRFHVWYGFCSVIQSTFDNWIEAQSEYWIIHFTNGLFNQRTESICHYRIHYSVNDENASAALTVIKALKRHCKALCLSTEGHALFLMVASCTQWADSLGKNLPSCIADSSSSSQGRILHRNCSSSDHVHIVIGKQAFCLNSCTSSTSALSKVHSGASR